MRWPLKKDNSLRMLKRTICALLYFALLASANTSFAQNYSQAEELRSGEMRKLLFADPKPVSNIRFMHEDGTELSLQDFQGKTIVLNFWATWCAPCRKEMPALEALRKQLGGDSFDVVAVATGPKNEPAKIAKFFNDNGISDLPVYLDPKSRFANDMGIRGLPITVVINSAGMEIARMRGDADWASENALAVIGAILSAEGS